MRHERGMHTSEVEHIDSGAVEYVEAQSADHHCADLMISKVAQLQRVQDLQSAKAEHEQQPDFAQSGKREAP